MTEKQCYYKLYGWALRRPEYGASPAMEAFESIKRFNKEWQGVYAGMAEYVLPKKKFNFNFWKWLFVQ